MTALRRAVFLDRDGVINRSIVRDGKPYAPDTLSQLVIVEDVPAALAALKAAGFLLIVVTNQPDVARGTADRATVEAMHDYLMKKLPLSAIYVCYHDDKDHCACRKPKPGMLQDAARDFDIDLSKSFMVGDRYRDVAAGQAAACRTVFIDLQYTEPFLADPPDYCAGTLTEAAQWILTQEKSDAT